MRNVLLLFVGAWLWMAGLVTVGVQWVAWLRLDPTDQGSKVFVVVGLGLLFLLGLAGLVYATFRNAE